MFFPGVHIHPRERSTRFPREPTCLANPQMRAAVAGRVLCVTMTSASGNVIVERFYEPRLSEREQMMWRARLHEASTSSAAAEVGEEDADRVAEVCGTARGGEHGEENMVWCRVGDLRFYAVGSGEYDELAREYFPTSCPRPPTPPKNITFVVFCPPKCLSLLSRNNLSRLTTLQHPTPLHLSLPHFFTTRAHAQWRRCSRPW